jgi:hypothetical protein
VIVRAAAENCTEENALVDSPDDDHRLSESSTGKMIAK